MGSILPRVEEGNSKPLIYTAREIGLFYMLKKQNQVSELNFVF